MNSPRPGPTSLPDCEDLPPLDVENMPVNTKGIWPKARLWGPKLGNLEGPVLFLDLDLVIVGSLDGGFCSPSAVFSGVVSTGAAACAKAGVAIAKAATEAVDRMNAFRTRMIRGPLRPEKNVRSEVWRMGF